MEDLFLILGVVFAVIMMILLVKYAGFINSFSKIQESRRNPGDGSDAEKGPAEKE